MGGGDVERGIFKGNYGGWGTEEKKEFLAADQNRKYFYTNEGGASEGLGALRNCCVDILGVHFCCKALIQHSGGNLQGLKEGPRVAALRGGG